MSNITNLKMSSDEKKLFCTAIFLGRNKLESSFMMVDVKWNFRTMCKKFLEEQKLNIDMSLYDIQSQVFVGKPKSASDFNLNGMSGYPIDYTIKTLLDFDEEYKYVAFKYDMKRMVDANDDESGSQKKRRKINAFDKLMSSASENTHLPPKVENPKDGKQKLKNQIIDYISSFDSVRFNANEEGKQVALVQTLLTTMWSLDGHQKKFEDAPKVTPLPDAFNFETQFRVVAYKGMKKKKLPNLDRKMLEELNRNLKSLLDLKWFMSNRFICLRDDIETLRKSINSYIIYLENKTRCITENHYSIRPVSEIHNRGIWKCKVVQKYIRKDKLARSTIIDHRYIELKKHIQKLNDYVYCNVREFAPEDRKKRHVFYNQLRLPFTVEVFEKDPGGNKEKFFYLWKVPEAYHDRDRTKTEKICQDLSMNIPRYHTRSMVKIALNKWKWLKKVSDASLNALYQEFSKDGCKPRSEIVEMIISKVNDGSDVTDLTCAIESSYKDRDGK